MMNFPGFPSSSAFLVAALSFAWCGGSVWANTAHYSFSTFKEVDSVSILGGQGALWYASDSQAGVANADESVSNVVVLKGLVQDGVDERVFYTPYTSHLADNLDLEESGQIVLELTTAPPVASPGITASAIVGIVNLDSAWNSAAGETVTSGELTYAAGQASQTASVSLDGLTATDVALATVDEDSVDLGAVTLAASSGSDVALQASQLTRSGLYYSGTVERSDTAVGASWEERLGVLQIIDRNDADLDEIPTLSDNGEQSSGLWSTSLAYGDGWRLSDWLGFINVTYVDKTDSNQGWIYHTEHGWLYSSGTSEDGLFLYDQELNWLYTSATDYPYLYYAQDAQPEWIYYYYSENGAEPARWFYRPSDRTWFSL